MNNYEKKPLFYHLLFQYWIRVCLFGKLRYVFLYPQLLLLKKLNWTASTIWNTNWPTFKAILHSLAEPETCKANTRGSGKISVSKNFSELLVVSFCLYFSSYICCILGGLFAFHRLAHLQKISSCFPLYWLSYSLISCRNILLGERIILPV